MTLVFLAILGYCLWQNVAAPVVLATIGALWTWVMFISSALKPTDGDKSSSLLKDDRVWGGLLALVRCLCCFTSVNQALGQAQKSGEQFFHW